MVGYLNKDVRENLSQQVCTFDQIGVKDGALDIQKLIPVDGNGDYIPDGEVCIQFINDRGKVIAQYGYYGVKEFDRSQTVAGWYDDNEEDPVYIDYEFGSGEAFQVYAAEACGFQYSGEVNMAETLVPFRENLSFFANMRPTKVDIQDLIPLDGDGEDAEYIPDGEACIQIFNDRGKIIAQYGYYGAKEFDRSQTVPGWYDDNEEDPVYVEKIFEAGEGFKIYAASAGYLRFPEL